MKLMDNLQVIAYAVWNLMAGFIIPKPRVPGWWIWLLYLNPAHWSFYVSFQCMSFHCLSFQEGMNITESLTVEGVVVL